jgi:outer membrane scaffolding protein for murein synthesis (MipA/OmpV family)
VDYGDRRYYGYYFDVTESYATAARPEYDAGSGYGGWGLSANLVRKITARWSLGLYAKWNNYAGAVFADSPLARSDNTFTLGAAIIGTLAESARRVHYEMSQ